MKNICYDCMKKAHRTNYGIIGECNICGFEKPIIIVNDEIYEVMKNDILNNVLRRG